MKFNHIVIPCLIGAFFASGSEAMAQKKLEEEVDVIRPYKPVLQDVNKIRRNPDFSEATTNKINLNYESFDQQLTKNGNISAVNPQNLPSEANVVLPLFYGKLGGGNLNSVLAEVYFNSAQSETEQYGFYYQAHSAKGELENQRSNRNNIGLYGKFIKQNFTTTASLNYKQRNAYFYGYDNLVNSFPKDVVLHKLNNFNAEVELASNLSPDRSLDYGVKVGGYSFKDNYKGKEGNAYVNGLIGNKFDKFDVYLAMNFDLTSTKDSTIHNYNNFFRANPFVKLGKERFRAELGLNLVANGGSQSSFNVFPNVSAEFDIVEKYLTLFGGVVGDLHKNTLNDFSDRNSFLGADIQIKNSKEPMKIYGGLKGTATTGLGFKIQFANSSIDDLPFFVNQGIVGSDGFALPAPGKFGVQYAGSKSKKTTFTGDLDYTASDKLRLGLQGIYNKFDLTDMDKPWLTPDYKMNLSATYQAFSKLSFSADLFNVGKQYALANPLNQNYIQLDGYTDMNLGVDFRFHKNFGAFINANNLFNKQYDLFLNYPSYGFNVIGGVTVTF